MTTCSMLGLRENNGVQIESDVAVAKSCVEKSFNLDARTCKWNRPPLFLRNHFLPEMATIVV